MDKLDLTTGRLERNVEEAGETLIQISLQYPQAAGGEHPVTETLNHCFTRMAENLVAALSLEMLGEARTALALMPETLPYQINGTFTTTYNAHGVISFYKDVFLYAGGMRGITCRYAGSFLTADSGRPLFMSAFFPISTDVPTLVSDFVTQRHGVEPSTVQTAFSPENFYLAEHGLVVFYPPGAVGPVAGGISVFTMPYEDEGPFSPIALLPEIRSNQ